MGMASGLLDVLKRMGPEGEALLTKLAGHEAAMGSKLGAMGSKAEMMGSKARSGLENFGLKHGMMSEDALSGGRSLTGKGKAALGGAGVGAAGLGGLSLAALMGDDDDEDDHLGI